MSLCAFALSGCASRKVADAKDEGYMLGQSDAIKRHYAMLQQLEKDGDDGRTRYYIIPGDEETEDGRVLVPHDVSIPIVE